MKFTIHKEKLKDASSKLRSCLASGSLNPILEHFYFELENNLLTVKSTNISLSMIWETKVDGEGEFSFTLPGSTLDSLVSSLEQEDIVFNYNPSTKDVHMKCGKYEWEAASGDTSDYPSLNLPDELEEITLSENFQSLLKKVYFSISGDVSKPDLNSLCIDVNRENSNKINLISTDRIRLSCASTPSDFKENLRFVIPKNSVGEIIKIEPSKMLFDSDMKAVYFKEEGLSGTFIVKTVLTNASYPDIYAYLNNDFQEKPVSVNKSELIKALKRVRLTSDKLQKVGTIEFYNSKATISSLGPSSKSKEEVEVDMSNLDSDPNPFNVKLDLMLEYLNQEDEDVVNFKVIDSKCLVFDKDNYRHVLSIEN